MTIPEYEVYGQPDCVWCVRAIDRIKEAGHAYRYIDVSDSDAGRADLLRRLESVEQTIGRPVPRTVPQIFRDGEHIGGFDDLTL